MAMTDAYSETAPTRAEIDQLDGPVVVEFGNSWCGHCRRAQPFVAAAFADHPRVRHIRIADGPGRRLGRSFGVKLWPTLVFMNQGREIARVVRPLDAEEMRRALEQIDA